MAKNTASAKSETIFERNKRWIKRKFTSKWTYKKGVFTEDKLSIIKYLKQPDVSVRLHADGQLNDGTSFVTISIEGIK